MKIDVLDLEGKKKKQVDLPSQFNEIYEPVLVKRAVIAMQNSERQAYGPFEMAGMQASSALKKRRRDYRSMYGKGISRTPRKITWRRGMQMGWTGATAPNTVGGRRSHPPLVEKIWEDKLNKKEKTKAIRSTLSGLVQNKKLVVAVQDLEAIAKTKDAKNVLEKIGFANELKRTKEEKLRSGKGKIRGRKKIEKRGVLIIVAETCKITMAARNMPGCDIANVNALNPALIAARNGDLRQVIFTENALNKMEKEKLYLK